MRTAKLVLLAVALLLGAAHAQEDTSPSVLAFGLANVMDGVMIECPVSPMEGVETACFRMDLSIDLTRTILEITMSDYNDVAWSTPWISEEPELYLRMLTTDWNRDYAFALLLWTDFETIVFVGSDIE